MISVRANNNRILMLLLIILLSSSIFEKGLDFFIENLGISIFVLTGITFLILFSWKLLTKKIRLFGRNILLHNKHLLLVYILYWFISLTGVLYTSEINAAFIVVVQYLLWYSFLFLFVFFTLMNFDIRKRILVFKAIGFFSFFILVAYSVYTYQTGIMLAYGLEKYSISAFRDYNVMSYSLFISILLMFLSHKQNERRILKFIMYIFFVSIAVAVSLLSGSRRSLVIYLPIMISIPLILSLFTSFKKLIISAFTIICGILIVLFIAFNTRTRHVPHLDSEQRYQLGFRMERSLGYFTGKYDVSHRLIRWGNALAVYERYTFFELILGKGTRSYFSEKEFIRGSGDRDSPHNFMLSALLEGGLIKLIVIMLFITLFIFTILKTFKGRDFWSNNFLVSATLMWLFSVAISGEEFFASRQFLVIFIFLLSIKPSKYDLFMK